MDTSNNDKKDNGSEPSGSNELTQAAIVVGGTVASVTLSAVAPMILAGASLVLVAFALFADGGGGNKNDDDDSGDGSTAGWGG